MTQEGVPEDFELRAVVVREVAKRIRAARLVGANEEQEQLHEIGFLQGYQVALIMEREGLSDPSAIIARFLARPKRT